MDQPPPAFSGRQWRSRLISDAPPSPPSRPQHVAPPKATMWDSTDHEVPSSNNPRASNISAHMETDQYSTGSPPLENSAAGRIAGWKAGHDWSIQQLGESAQEIARRRATCIKQAKLNRFHLDDPGHLAAAGGRYTQEIARRKATCIGQQKMNRFYWDDPGHLVAAGERENASQTAMYVVPPQLNRLNYWDDPRYLAAFDGSSAQEIARRRATHVRPQEVVTAGGSSAQEIARRRATHVRPQKVVTAGGNSAREIAGQRAT